MGLIQKPHTFMNNVMTIDADEVNENFDRLYDEFNGRVDDVNLGTRTINDQQAPNSNTGSLTTLLSGLANRIKTITGKPTWRDNPDKTLAQLSQHADSMLVNGTHGVLVGAESQRPAPGQAGRLYIATGTAQRIWRDTGSAWELVAGVPKGVIQIWSGAINQIPTGWILCAGGTVQAADGSTLTVPDLRDRFIVGAGGSYAVGNTGGAAQVTLTVNQIPAHSHSASTSSAGRHTHGVTVGQAGAHKHQVAGPRASRMGGWDQVAGGEAFHVGSANRGREAYSSEDGAHTHSVTIHEGGEHTHSVTIGNTGGGQPHENRPPYYALCFIMKL